MSRIIITDSPNAPRPADELTRDIADGLRRIENNYTSEGSGPGSRFEGQLLEDAQATWALREMRTRAEASEDFVIRLDALLLTAVLASPRSRSLLASCLLCRNSLLVLLDHPAGDQRGIHRRIRTRLGALEFTHEGHRDDSPDAARPRLRGVLWTP